MGPSPLVFYISGHGFGHATRIIEVMKALHSREPDFLPIVKSRVPRWLFEAFLDFPFQAIPFQGDVGVVQEGLRVDLPKTLEALRRFQEREKGLVREETAFLQRIGAKGVVGDIPPLAFRAASRAGVPGIAVANFGWDWIYDSYREGFPAFGPFAEEARWGYAEADLLLRLPFHGEMSAFPVREDCPAIVGRRGATREEVRQALGIREEERVVLFSFGGVDLPDLGPRSLRGRGSLTVLTSLEALRGAPGVRWIPREKRPHFELVKASDVVVTKPGYGIAVECIAHRRPLLYTYRGPFPEYGILVGGMKRYLPTRFVSREDLKGGRFFPAVRELLQEEVPQNPFETCGAERAASRILEVVEEFE
jgi:UDP:flavonoid glycosyltransferase YjiC (YdhE family)